MHKSIVPFLMVCLSSALSFGQAPLFDMQQIADGVYAAIARPQLKLNSNAAVIVNEDGVLVYDTHSKPSAARALIAQVRELTGKPVRYVVNSHFHLDHVQGNQAYPAAFPLDVTIISSESTRELIIAKGLQKTVVNHPSIKQQIELMPAEIEELQKRLAAAKDPGTVGKLQEDLVQAEAYLSELRTMEITLPDLTFDKSLILHKKDRDIFILFLGRGHTAGDAILYLPKEKVVATGDLLHAWMPYMPDSFPPEWVTTLDQLLKLDFNHIIGGHGDVLPKSHVTFWRNYLADLIVETRQAIQRGESLQQARESVASALAPKYKAGMAAHFRAINGNIAKVYRDMEAKKY